jgi:hypothetical protein
MPALTSFPVVADPQSPMRYSPAISTAKADPTASGMGGRVGNVDARRRERYDAFLRVYSATGSPAAFHAVKPPSSSHTGSSPICWATSAANADRHAPLQ